MYKENEIKYIVHKYNKISFEDKPINFYQRQTGPVIGVGDVGTSLRRQNL